MQRGGVLRLRFIPPKVLVAYGEYIVPFVTINGTNDPFVPFILYVVVDMVR